MTSLILQTSMRLIMPLSLLFAAYMALKGHNEPGGGFVGGLIAAIALILYRMSDGPNAFKTLIPIHPRIFVFVGLSLALVTAVLPLLFGLPLLTSYVSEIHIFGEPIHLVSAIFFDTGVLLVVVGVSIGMITRLSEELEQ